MAMRKILTYLLLIGVFSALTWLVIAKGNEIVRISNEIYNDPGFSFENKAKPVVIDSQENVYHQFLNNLQYPLSILLLQIIIILVISRLFGFVFKIL